MVVIFCNGTASMLGKFATLQSCYSDASNWGFGGLYSYDWIAGSFYTEDNEVLKGSLGHHFMICDKKLIEEHINVKEMWAVYASALKWAPKWCDSQVIFITDNLSVQLALNTGRSRCSGIMKYLRKLFWLSVDYNCTFSATYINKRHNLLCDSLSRLNMPGSLIQIKNLTSFLAIMLRVYI